MDQVGIKIEDFMEVVYKCKFCPYSCTQSPEMGIHVRSKHLSSGSALQVENQSGRNNAVMKMDTGIPSSTLALALDAAVSEAVGNSSKCTSSIATSTVGVSNISTSNPSSSNSGTNFNIQDSEDVLGFSSDSQAFMDKGLAAASFAPLAVPVTQGGSINLSNASTPDLTELINLVKPSENSIMSTNGSSGGHLFTSAHLTSSDYITTSSGHLPITVSGVDHLSAVDGQLAMASVVQLQPGPTSMSSLSQSFSNSAVVSADLEGLGTSQPYTVMAIHLPNLAMTGSNTVPQYVVSAPVSEAINIPEQTETKEFLLCGLCKLAFTTMEECQAHMQAEHKDLMQGSGISIGVQAGGAKRGRKRKSEQQHKIKQEPILDPEDLEWLPSVTDNNRSSHPDGRVRRKVRPPRALKEDYVLGKRVRKRVRESCTNLGYKIVCPMMNCKAKFKTDLGLHTHMTCHNLDDTAFTCKECQAPFEFWKLLRMHLWREHKLDCDLFTCDRCSYKTDTHHKMNIHKEIHADIKPYTCDVCGKGFRQASQMKNHQVTHVHQNTKEGGKGWFSSKTCDICDRVFANSKCLKKHKEAVHTNIKPFECIYCSHTTARKAMMELHMRTHTGEKPFKCDICPYSTGDHNSLRRHKMRHTGQKQYRCTQCPYTCIQSISLKQHMRHKHPGTSAGIFQCSRCPFRTINQAIYSNHMQDHKKGLIPDKIIPQRLELPKAKKIPRRSQVGSAKRLATGQTVVEPLLIKHPQFHAVLPGEEPASLTSLSGDTVTGGNETQAEVFNMQVTMLPEGDTQISADDMTRLSESPGLLATGVSPLQLIYATLSTIAEQREVVKVEEGRSALLTAELIGGIHTAVLSSMQDGVTVHSVTYHLPKSGGGNVGEEGVDKMQTVTAAGAAATKDTGITKASKLDSGVEGDDEGGLTDKVVKVEPTADPNSSMGAEILHESHVGRNSESKPEEIFFIGDVNKSDESVIVGEEINMENEQKRANESEDKLLVSSTLREMLESNEKVTVLNTQNGEVRFIAVDFLDPTVIDVTSAGITLSTANENETETV